jgi:homoserine O-acetyltransferase/O-succinyltransferase
MSLLVESTPVELRPPAALRTARQHLTTHEGVLELPGPFALHHGGQLREVRIAWRLVGADEAPVVCALGGISAHRRVCLAEAPHEGWWAEIVGPGRALDTEAWRILSFDYLGGAGESTGPAAHGQGGGADFPSLSSYDQAEALARLLDHLGLERLAGLVGGSYGGMVGLAFGERYPEKLAHLIAIGAPERSHPLATAWRSIQRRIVTLAAASGEPQEGLKLARALAMTTYRTPEELGARFGGCATRDGRRFVFPIEEYLYARGADYAARYRTDSFLCLSESIDLHRVEPTRIFVPTAVVAVREDQLVPLADLRALAARLPHGRLHEISSLYGHDAFLKESRQLRGIFHAALTERP